MLKRKIILIHKTEMLDVWEWYDSSGKLKNYWYSYKVWIKNRWQPIMKWDNFNEPHIDRYDEIGNHIGKVMTTDKSLNEVLKIVKTFRRSISSINPEYL